MKVIIIGGGPAGIMAAISARKCGNDVTIYEKMSSIGKKLLITGKGRCNITSGVGMSEFINNIPGNGKFLYSAFQNFTNEDIIKLLEDHGVKVKEERGNRIFPVSDKSSDVLNALYEELKRLNINIFTNAKVNRIIEENGIAIGIEYNFKGKDNKDYGDKIIIATGGKSYPTTGSTGDGYKLATDVGHSISKIKPSLIPMLANESDSIEKLELRGFHNSRNLCRKLQGLSLRNVGISIVNSENTKCIYNDFGEMLFTHFGVSGPTILSASAHIIRYIGIDELLKNGSIRLKVDLKPALDKEKLDLRIQRDFEKSKNKLFKNSLNELLPQKLINPIIELSDINPDKKVNEISKKERAKIVNLIKEFSVTLTGFRSIEEAIVTAGGICIKEINPKTMESKLIKNLYFAGEVIDVDAYTGGFNLQIAYSTGYTAGLNS